MGLETMNDDLKKVFKEAAANNGIIVAPIPMKRASVSVNVESNLSKISSEESPKEKNND
jgi:hypothetical protein